MIERWTPENLERAIGILRGHDSVDRALPAMSRAFGFEVTRSALDKGLTRRGHARASKHLRSADDKTTTAIDVEIPVHVDDAWDDKTDPQIATPVAEPDPVVVSAAERTAHRLRGQLADLEARHKHLLADIVAKEDELSTFKSLARGPIHIEAPKIVGATQRFGVPVAVFSDWHVEEEVDPATVNGLNKYNLEIADACIDRCAEAFAWMLCDPRWDCRIAVLALIGDLISGYIHPELIENNLLSPQDTIIWLLERIEKMLRKIAALCPNLERIIVPCVSGNHGRATEKIRVSTRESNSNENVLYHTLARVLRDEPRFEFSIATGQWLEVDVMGYQMAFTHGDSFKYGGGVGGVSIPIRRGIAREFSGRKFHQYIMGHFHTRQDFGDIQINGSMIGYSPYSQFIHAAPEARQQAFFMIDSKRGKCISAPLWLDD